MVQHAVECVLALLILIAVGWFLSGKEWFSAYGADLFSKFCVRIAIPCYMVYNVVSVTPTRADLGNLIRALPVPMTTMLVSCLLGVLLAKVLHIVPPRRGVFINAVAFSNTVIIGFPVISSIFGEGALPDAMIYYMSNTMLFWTIGAYLLRADGPQKASLFSLEGIKKIFSMPVCGFLAGVVLVLLEIDLPEFIMMPIEMIKNTTTAIAMIFIGSVLRQADLRHMKLTKDLTAVLCVRFLMLPLCTACICMMMPITMQQKQVFFVLSTMPAMTQLGIVARESQSDDKFASVVVALTTAVSMVVLPLYIWVITAWGIFA